MFGILIKHEHDTGMGVDIPRNESEYSGKLPGWVLQPRVMIVWFFGRHE